MLSGGQHTTANPRRLEISSQTLDASVGHHDGRQQNHRPQEPTLRGIERPTLRPPRKK